ncbi:MAG TPA: hypothetical protein VFY71_11480 [Planctomycetota bacterium]|nr:hypothetical protein [Planctomycetota bacterium]
MILLACPFLKKPVRVSTERERHVLAGHGELAARWPAVIAQVLADPDEICWDETGSNTMLLARWYPHLLQGKFVVVVVVLDATARQQPWLVTAYVARRWRKGVVAWRRS